MQTVRWFNQKLLRRPKTTEIITAFILTYNSDSICQYLEARSKGQSILETFSNDQALKIAGYRAFIVTPVLHYWYLYLSRKIPGKSFGTVLFKSLLDRLTIGPVILISFFGFHAYSNGGGIEEFKQKMKRDFIKTNELNITYWTALLMVNFKYVPIELQVIVVNLISFGWMIYLCHTLNKETTK